MSEHDQDGGDDESAGHHGAAEIDVRAPFTRRTFLAGAGAAAAATLAGSATAHAAGAGVAIYRIHPAIGVARLGNAPAGEYFIGPEVPGYGPLNNPGEGGAVPNYKNGAGQLKPQAARFRIFKYEMVVGALTAVGEVNLDTPGVSSIAWSVHLANKKASFYEALGGEGENREPGPLRNPAVTDRRTLEIDFGPRSVSGRAQAQTASQVTHITAPAGYVPAQYAPKKPDGSLVIDNLGELRTDTAGRLLVIGGKGKAGFDTATQPPMPHWANNTSWFDDASDGPVTAVLTLSDGTVINIDATSDGGAWVLCGPPDFAPGIPGSITGYDLMCDVAVHSIAIPPATALYQPGGELADLVTLQAQVQGGGITLAPSFPDHIQPMLVAAYNHWWIDGLVTSRHNTLLDPALGDPAGSAASKRTRVFQYMRPPLNVAGSGGSQTMPRLLGDDPYIGQMPEAKKHLPLTRLQYERLRQWANGNFVTTSSEPSGPVITAHGLDRAALENCVGGAFYPGIEFGWQMRNPDLFLEPFRLDLDAPSGYWGEAAAGKKLGPGHFSRQLAVPWQADFNDCRNEGSFGWWPAQRPTDALVSATATRRSEWARPTNRFVGGNRESTHEDMVTNWYKFGFVLEHGDLFVEKERAPEII